MNYYTNDYYYGYNDSSATTGILALSGVYMIFMLAIAVFSIVCMWKIYKKAGKKGWESLIPIYNLIVLLEIVNLPTWYIALFLIPFANIYAMFKIYIELAHKFGKSTGFGVLTVFFSIICMPILAFGNNTYNGSTKTSNATQTPIDSQSSQNTNSQSSEQTQLSSEPVEEKRFCTNCGNQVDKTDVFCNNCGNKL